MTTYECATCGKDITAQTSGKSGKGSPAWAEYIDGVMHMRFFCTRQHGYAWEEKKQEDEYRAEIAKREDRKKARKQ